MHQAITIHAPIKKQEQPHKANQRHTHQPARQPSRQIWQWTKLVLRKLFFLGLCAVAVATFFCNRYWIKTEATIMAGHIAASIRSAASSAKIQQQKEGYEQEVNQIAQAGPVSNGSGN